MTEYKERNAAIAEYIKQKIQGGKKSICDSCTHRNVCKAIDNQPCTECNHYQCTADVEPVKRGRWNDWEVFWKECSCCGYRTQKINVREYFFCPNCGADMRGRTMDVMKGLIEPMGMEAKEE